MLCSFSTGVSNKIGQHPSPPLLKKKEQLVVTPGIFGLLVVLVPRRPCTSTGAFWSYFVSSREKASWLLLPCFQGSGSGGKDVACSRSRSSAMTR
jgi:hypothetical protein